MKNLKPETMDKQIPLEKMESSTPQNKKFLCITCNIEFDTNMALILHAKSGHKGMNGVVKEEPSHSSKEVKDALDFTKTLLDQPPEDNGKVL